MSDQHGVHSAGTRSSEPQADPPGDERRGEPPPDRDRSATRERVLASLVACPGPNRGDNLNLR